MESVDVEELEEAELGSDESLEDPMVSTSVSWWVVTISFGTLL